MKLCRACLSSDKELYPSDDNFICNYNLLTNINIKFCDGKPQQFCQVCIEAVNFFIEFRNKCVSAESALVGIIKQVVKSEAEAEIDTSTIKVECKLESEDYDSFLDDSAFNCTEDDNGQYYAEDDKCIIKAKDTIDAKKKRPRRQCNKKESAFPKKKNDTASSTDKYTKLTSEKPICGLCTAAFENVASLNKHLQGHHGDSQCQQCPGLKFEGWPQLLAHRILHTVHHQKCHLCNIKFRSHKNLEFHYRKVHSEEKNVLLECHLCPNKFTSPRRLAKHIWGIHSNNKYICDICSKSHNNKQGLKNHLMSHGDVKPYVCNLCGFRSKYSGGLKAHQVRRHAPKKCICRGCGCAFENPEKLEKHVCVEKSRICPFCGKVLRKGYVRHVATHTEERRYKCSRCPSSFKSRSSLKVHNDKHDNNPTQQCEYCLVRFYSPSVLIKHRRVHTGEKPYACKKCDMRFTGCHNLKVHMKVHGEMLVVKRNQEAV